METCLFYLDMNMNSIWTGKKILVGVTGSIAAFKVAGWVSDLIKSEADVDVIMTTAASQFITPITMSGLTGKTVYLDMFDEQQSMSHIDLGRECDLFLIAPASANTIAKLANGIADNLLTAAVLACRSKVVVCPAMNPDMYAHPATQYNLQKLRDYGYKVLEPDSGLVACGEEGKGRLPEWDDVREQLSEFIVKQDLRGETVLVTAGPTREPIDPARFISNRSSGKMGYSIAKAARQRGAKVILISGPVSLARPKHIETINVTTADEMFRAVSDKKSAASIIIKSAAVSDFRPEKYHSEKVKKDKVEDKINLIQNRDILKYLGDNREEGQLLIGFAAESENIIENGRKKLQKKNLDMIAVNDISHSQTGFESSTNQLHILTEAEELRLPLTSKEHAAHLLLDQILRFKKDVK